MAKVDPESLIIVGLIGAIGAAGTYVLYKAADVLGPELSIKDLLPSLPPDPPLPRFLTNKHKVLESVKEMFATD